MNSGFPRTLFLFLVASALAFLPGCSDMFKKDISEGIIEFNAEPVDSKRAGSFTVPDKMVVKFKNNYTAAELEAGWGMAKMKFISDPVTKLFRTQVFFIDKKQSVMDIDELNKTNHYFTDYDVVYTEESKEIAGYTCKKATIKFKDGSPSVDVWYTKDIAIKDPNWSNAYYKVDGVLLDYTLRKFGLELHFTATSVSDATIDDSHFTIPAEYGMVRNSEIETMFAGFYK
jgi:hypothetical protein